MRSKTCCQSKLTRVRWDNRGVISLNWKVLWPFQATVHFPLQILTWNHYHKSQPCGGPLWFLSFKYIHFLKETQLISKTHSSVVVIRLIATELWMHLRMSAQYISHHPSPPARQQLHFFPLLAGGIDLLERVWLPKSFNESPIITFLTNDYFVQARSGINHVHVWFKKYRKELAGLFIEPGIITDVNINFKKLERQSRESCVDWKQIPCRLRMPVVRLTNCPLVDCLALLLHSSALTYLHICHI